MTSSAGRTPAARVVGASLALALVLTWVLGWSAPAGADTAAGDQRAVVLATLVGSPDTAAEVGEAVAGDAPGAELVRTYEHLPVVALDGDAATVAALRADPRVAAVSVSRGSLSTPSAEGTEVDDLPVGSVAAHAGGWDGTGAVVAVLDTGLDVTHPAFQGAIAGGACYSRIALDCPGGAASGEGVASAAACATTKTECGHGTHVAGIAVGRTPTGIAPDARVLPIRVTGGFTVAQCESFGIGVPPGGDGCQAADEADELAALDYVLQRKAAGLDVVAVNISLNDPSRVCGETTTAFQAAVGALTRAGVAVVASTGNRFDGGARNDGGDFPTCVPDVVSVSATTFDDKVPYYANVGAGTDLLAPGDNVQSAFPAVLGAGTAEGMSGTSMAAPMVAGALAVLDEARPDLSVSGAVGLLRSTGTPVTVTRLPRPTPTAPRPALPRLQLAAALAQAIRPPTPATPQVAVDGDHATLTFVAPAVATPGKPVVALDVTDTATGVVQTFAGTATRGSWNAPLAPGSHRFTLTARNAVGSSPSSAAAVVVVTQVLPIEVENPVVGSSTFVPVPPQRLLDTREGAGTPPPLGPQQEVVVDVAGRLGLPAATIKAVALTVTYVGAAAPGYVVAWPDGAGRPATSSLNADVAGQTIANLVVVATSDAGRVRLATQAGGHLVVDVAGYWTPAATATAGRYTALAPDRLLDTRAPGGAAVGAGVAIDLQVAGKGGVPATGAAAVALTVTATDAAAPGYVTAWPATRTRPLVSNLNVERPGQTIADLVLVPLGPNGQVSLFSQAGTHLVVDVVGWFGDASAPSGTAGLLVPVAPSRMVDTREDLGVPAVVPGVDAAAAIGGHGPVPAGAAAVIGNLTATGTAAAGYVTVWPSGVPRPLASSVNAERAGQTIASGLVATLGADGGLGLFAQSGTELIVDVTGWFTA